MGAISRYLDALVREFSRLPGVGPKSASRLAFHVLRMPEGDVRSLVDAIREVREHITACAVCGGIADGERCAICADPARDRGVICVVEQQKDVLTVERSGAFTGLYHVLNGVISPLDGIGPEELNIKPLLERCKDAAVVEIVIATNPSVEGDATSLYLSKIIKPSGIKVTRIAHGIPVGADLEFADGATIYQSLKCRVEM